MARHHFVIHKYTVNVAPGSTASGGLIFDQWLACETVASDGRKHTCNIYFFTQGSRIKSHQMRTTGNTIRATLYFPESLYQTVIDLLRVGQRPIVVKMDSERPENAKIVSSPEFMRRFDRTLLIPDRD